jgi:hypothetical protein
MSLRLAGVPNTRTAAERGALTAAAGALLVLGATAAWRPDLLAILLRAEPNPQILPLMAFAAALPAGGELGRRAIRLSASAVQRRRRLVLWTFLAYVASVMFGAAALSVTEMGPGALADPYMLVGKGLTISLLLFPWAAFPLFVTAVALERWTRPPRHRATRGGPGGGPGPGTRARRPAPPPVDVGPERRAA